MEGSSSSGSTVIPCILYRDAQAAIEWLCSVLGFEKHQVFTNPDGFVVHGELRLGGGMLIVGSIGDTPYCKLVKHPDETSGFETQSPYVIVPDADAAHDRAVALGGEIVLPLKTEDYGGRGFTCRDLEGRLWNVGTYSPWPK